MHGSEHRAWFFGQEFSTVSIHGWTSIFARFGEIFGTKSRSMSQEGGHCTGHCPCDHMSAGWTFVLGMVFCFVLVMDFCTSPDTCDRRRREATNPSRASFHPLPVTPDKNFSKPSKYGRPSVDGHSRKFLSEEPRAGQKIVIGLRPWTEDTCGECKIRRRRGRPMGSKDKKQRVRRSQGV